MSATLILNNRITGISFDGCRRILLNNVEQEANIQDLAEM